MSDIVASSFNVTVAGPLAAYLATPATTTSGLLGALATNTASNGTASAVNILGGGINSSGGVFNALKGNANGGSATTNALVAGALTTVEQKVIATIGANGATPTQIPWNTNGTEPSTIANLRGYGWIRLVSKSTDPSTGKPNGGNYVLTPVGQAIYQRTGGGQVNAQANTAAPSTSDAATAQAAANAQSAAQQAVQAAAGLLSSFGINITA